MAVRATKRIERELQKFSNDAGESGLILEVVSNREWLVTFTMAEGTVYAGELYTLKIIFTDDYPMDSPIVVFEQPAPEHEHVYSNGHICLNILDSDWSPALTMCSVCLSIQSMLASAEVKMRPPGNDRYVRSGAKNPKQTSWLFDDDKV